MSPLTSEAGSRTAGDRREAGDWKPKVCRAQWGIALFLATLIQGVSAYPTPLLVAAEDDAAPWSQSDGTGYANDVVRAAFQAAGAEIDLRVIPYARGKDMVMKGKAVACFSMSWSPELAGKVQFARKPLFICYAEYFTSVKKPLKASREQDLAKGTLVGVVSGYEYPPSVMALKEGGIVVFEPSESEELNLKKLAAGRIDAALVNHNETKPVELMFAKAGITGQAKRAFRSGVLESYIGFSTAHPEGGKAMALFNKGFQIIARNGTLRAIESRWRKRALQEISRLKAGRVP